MLSSAFSNFILVAPLCLIIIGLCFCLYWSLQRQFPYLLWFSFTAILAGCNLLALSLIPPAEIYRWAFGLGFVYLATYISLLQAICLRFATQVSWRFCGLVVLLVQSGIFYYAWVDNQITLRVAISGLGFIALCAHVWPVIYRAPSQHHIDQWLKGVFYLLSAYLLLREAFLVQLIWRGAAEFHYTQSVFWFVTQLASLFFLWLFSVLFLVSNIKDRLNVLFTERNIDVLTGVTNRRCFFECATQYCPPAPHIQHALFMCDLDHFKQINDHHGHQVGDEVLKTFASTVRSVLREKDVLARIGGEEFVGILCDTNLQEALRVIERISQALSVPLRVENEGEIQVTASFGLVMLTEFTTVEAALKAADSLMYQAKAAGRNNVQYVLSSA